MTIMHPLLNRRRALFTVGAGLLLGTTTANSAKEQKRKKNKRNPGPARKAGNGKKKRTRSKRKRKTSNVKTSAFWIKGEGFRVQDKVLPERWIQVKGGLVQSMHVLPNYGYISPEIFSALLEEGVRLELIVLPEAPPEPDDDGFFDPNSGVEKASLARNTGNRRKGGKKRQAGNGHH